MKRRHLAFKLTLATAFFFAGCVITSILTHEWIYSLIIDDIKIIEADGGDYLKVTLQSHPPWAQQHTNYYLMNLDEKTIKIVSSYVILSPFSIRKSSLTHITNFVVLIPGDALPEGTYEIQHYEPSGNWKIVGMLTRDSNGRLNHQPRH